MHKLVGPMPRDERWSPQRDSLPLSNELVMPVRRGIERAVTRLSGDALWLRMWWENGGRDTLVSLVIGRPAPLLVGAAPRRTTARR
ncbi:MAG: hypothetical protein ACJ77B_05205 [Chloroflexota bacterium]